MEVCIGYAAMGGNEQTRAAGEVAELILRGEAVTGPRMIQMWSWVMGGGRSLAMIPARDLVQEKKFELRSAYNSQSYYI